MTGVKRDYEIELEKELAKMKEGMVSLFRKLSTGSDNVYGRYYTGRLQANYEFYRTTPRFPFLGNYNRHYETKGTLNTGLKPGANEALRTFRERTQIATILNHDFRRGPIKLTNLLSRTSNPKINYYLDGGGLSETSLAALLRQHLR